MKFVLDGDTLTLEQLAQASSGSEVVITDKARKAMSRSAQTIAQVSENESGVYGVNTGFGAFARERISAKDVVTLQYNLVRSHAAGYGSPLSPQITRRIMLLKANSLASGISGARPELADALAAMLSADVLPLIPERGSVGASGDLAPLAHLALALIGEGEARHSDQILHNEEVMTAAGLAPLTLAPKEGLALLNGTQVSTAVALEGLFRGENLLRSAILAGALSLEGLAGSYTPFDARLHTARRQIGQQNVAKAFRTLLSESAIWQSHRNCGRVQDPYSLRCMPQVLGASADALSHAAVILEREANAVTDNPLVFGDEVLSGGNFHAEPVAMVADYLALAITEVGNLAERRIDLLMRRVNPNLSSFIATQPGLESGFMLAHVTAAALASENKTLAHPASIDTIPTSAGQEDHVSMAPWAGLKMLRICDNVAAIIAIECLAATAALDQVSPLTTTEELAPVYRKIRDTIGPHCGDHRSDRDIAKVQSLILQGDLVRSAPDSFRTIRFHH